MKVNGNPRVRFPLLQLNWIFFAILVMSIGQMKAQGIPVDTFSIGSIGSSHLGADQKVRAEGFRKGFYIGRSGLPTFGKCATISGNQPAFSIRLGRKSLFFFRGEYFEVIKFDEINENKYHVDYFDCIRLPEKPTKGHILNLPKEK